MTVPNIIDSWFRLMGEAMGGSSEAQDAFKLLTGSSPNQADMLRWMGRFMPAATGMNMSQFEGFEDWIEQWWRVMGVVPRYRYLELLERNEELRRKLEDSEKARKRGLPNISGQPAEEAQKAMNLWGNMLDETLKLQSDWMRKFVTREGDKEPSEGETREGKTEETKHTG